MEQKSPREIQAALSMPFAPEDLEWRLQTTLEERQRGLAVPYVTNRAIQNRLDDVVGPDNWCNEYKPWHSAGKKEAQLCGISINYEGRGWITKWDGAEDSDIEPIKGGLSDSMKRCAVQWGIGRVLYNMDTVWVGIEKRGKTWYIMDSERPKLDKAYTNMLAKLGLTPAKAGGTQAQLTPKKEPEAAKAPATPNGNVPAETVEKAAPQTPPKQEAKPQAPIPPEPTKITNLPDARPEWEYTVVSAKVEHGMRGDSTRLALADRKGKQITAFMRGAYDDLAPGAQLYNVKLATRQQDTVVFYVLEQYEAIAPAQRAA